MMSLKTDALFEVVSLSAFRAFFNVTPLHEIRLSQYKPNQEQCEPETQTLVNDLASVIYSLLLMQV